MTLTIAYLQNLKESEDHVEFKEAKRNFPFDAGSHTTQEERRKCVLGYIVALANEGGGYLVFGMSDVYPHQVVGTSYASGRVGTMEDEIYKRLKIRVHCHELYDTDQKRVLVFDVPSRPIGRTLKYEGVPLMRIGDSLRNMDDDQLYAILSEQEPDFSAQDCMGLSLSDLDPDALELLRQGYRTKQQNGSILSLNQEQLLSDLKLYVGGRLNYASLILLCRASAIAKFLPQCKIVWEYRKEEQQIPFDDKQIIEGPLFLAIEKIWQLVNQPALNPKTPVQLDAYIFDIYHFNKEVVREAILNAVAHRDYRMTSEVVIRQYPKKLIINNPGGFPRGVNIENILTVSSTPRSRLMTEILEKAGLVERSGQGVDKIFSYTLSEGKPEPNYNRSDNFQVTLELSAEVIDKAFYVFVTRHKQSQQRPFLGVEQIITLCKIREGHFNSLRSDCVSQLLEAGLIRRVAPHSNRYLLSDEYTVLSAKEQRVGKRYIVAELEKLLKMLAHRELRIGELEVNLETELNRNQIKHLLSKLKEDGVVQSLGIGSGMRYAVSDEYKNQEAQETVNTIVGVLKEKYKEG